MTLQEMLVWANAHPLVVVAVLVYVIANIAPRPAPTAEQPRIVRLFWLLVDRTSVLTAEAVPGKLKWLLAPSPVLADQPKGDVPPEPLPVVLPVTPESGDKFPPEKGS